jgi:hypothetical protein
MSERSILCDAGTGVDVTSDRRCIHAAGCPHARTGFFAP